MREMHRREFLAVTAASLAVPTALRAADKPPLKVLFFGGDLPEIRKALEADFALTVFRAGQVGDTRADNVRGLEQLAEADVWIGSAHKRTFPSDEQLAYFKKHLAAGKPFVGYRAASHVFENWLAADREVFGARYGGHHLLNKDPELVIRPVGEGADHPILKGLAPPAPRSGSYQYTEVADDVTVLLQSGLGGDLMPHTWVRQHAKTGSRVFYTRYDAKDLNRDPTCRAIFLRGLAWALQHKA
jgi:type 1 glutamine amidotransferase